MVCLFLERGRFTGITRLHNIPNRHNCFAMSRYYPPIITSGINITCGVHWRFRSKKKMTCCKMILLLGVLLALSSIPSECVKPLSKFGIQDSVRRFRRMMDYRIFDVILVEKTCALPWTYLAPVCTYVETGSVPYVANSADKINTLGDLAKNELRTESWYGKSNRTRDNRCPVVKPGESAVEYTEDCNELLNGFVCLKRLRSFNFYLRQQSKRTN